MNVYLKRLFGFVMLLLFPLKIIYTNECFRPRRDKSFGIGICHLMLYFIYGRAVRIPLNECAVFSLLIGKFHVTVNYGFSNIFSKCSCYFLDCVPELAVWYDDAVLLGKEAHQTMQLFGVSAEFL